QDGVFVQVLHGDELSFPWGERSMLRFEDLRGLRPSLEAPGRSLRDEYLRKLAAHLRRLDERCEAEGLVLVRTTTDEPVEDAFVGLLDRLAGAAGQATTETEVRA